MEKLKKSSVRRRPYVDVAAVDGDGNGDGDADMSGAGDANRALQRLMEMRTFFKEKQLIKRINNLEKTNEGE